MPEVTLFLCGDVMTGRGIDQILAFPGDPEIREPYVALQRRPLGAPPSVDTSFHKFFTKRRKAVHAPMS